LHDVTLKDDLRKRKNDILDVLGHDLRAPLGAIKQNFDVLVESTGLKAGCNDQQKKFLDNCKNNITRMGRLIEKIMDMRQLETGKILLKYDVIEPNALLEQAVTSLAQWAGNKKIKLAVKADRLPDIDGDPERLYQVITNIVSNALKFTPEEGTIEASARIVQDKGVEYIQVAVKDSGMGIDPANIGKIFDKYEQVTANAPSGVSGLGLGLSICKAVVELHGGSIWAESKLGAGSTFASIYFLLKCRTLSDSFLALVI
jgi:two-component system OmpR family sensor kinase